MASQDEDIVRIVHHRDPVVHDAIGGSVRHHSEHADRDARDRLEAMLRRLSDEMTERARALRNHLSS